MHYGSMMGHIRPKSGYLLTTWTWTCWTWLRCRHVTSSGPEVRLASSGRFLHRTAAQPQDERRRDQEQSLKSLKVASWRNIASAVSEPYWENTSAVDLPFALPTEWRRIKFVRQKP
ncbi:hypothetical protein F4805DRAFT_460485 [Annulohypoxylon moriforme]|nr:hypothetical protein F4805DRAFT_460485 [Annulohypoxylon moriforme]